jgi:hypothetical protein
MGTDHKLEHDGGAACDNASDFDQRVEIHLPHEREKERERERVCVRVRERV